jgi:hypothetical protein
MWAGRRRVEDPDTNFTNWRELIGRPSFGCVESATEISPGLTRGGKVTFEDTPDIPEFGRDESEAERPRFDQLKPATSDPLFFAFRRCHNYIAGNQGLQKPQAFWELLKLIFCKIHDERHSDEVGFFAGANERHGVNGPLKSRRGLMRCSKPSKTITKRYSSKPMSLTSNRALDSRVRSAAS